MQIEVYKAKTFYNLFTLILQNFEFIDMNDVTNDEIDAMIRDGDVDKIEMVVLSGRGADLRGKSSWNEDTRKVLKKVPGYMVNEGSLI